MEVDEGHRETRKKTARLRGLESADEMGSLMTMIRPPESLLMLVLRIVPAVLAAWLAMAPPLGIGGS
ncbi:MAG: hypothetical protein R2826_08230 [Thermoleophilia bacterium]